MLDYQKIRILIAEDDLSTRKLIKTICHGMGIGSILEAADGQDAFATLRQPPKSLLSTRRTVDLIVSDWMMPRLSGIELLKAVRTHHRFKSIPFILLTAERDRDNITEAIALNVTDYIIKPFTADALEQKIIKVLSELP